MDITRDEILETLYRESTRELQSEQHHAEAETRVQRAASLAREENINISESILSVAERGQMREVNTLVAQKLGRQPTP